jgi:hypothetical protein
MDSKSWAKWLVSEFRKRNAGGVWLNVQASQVANELDQRIDSPYLINQNSTPYCGYAAIAYNAAVRAPQDYAWFVISLFESGAGNFGLSNGSKVTIRPSAGLRNQRRPTLRFDDGSVTQMPQADWIAIASLHEHFIASVWDIGESIPIFSPLIRALHGGATPGEITDALKKLGCPQTYDQSSNLAHKDLGTLNAANGHYTRGRVVVLRINADLLTENCTTPTGLISRGNHWVGMAGPVQLSPDNAWVSAQVFSWGKLMEVPGGGMMETERFLSRFHGYVVGYL